jgi:hypothetical protein
MKFVNCWRFVLLAALALIAASPLLADSITVRYQWIHGHSEI